MRPARRRARDEAGNALIEFTWLAIILLIPLIWVVISVFEVQRGAFAVSAAARSAGRAYSLAPDPETGEARAAAAMAYVLSDQGQPGQSGTTTIRCEPTPASCLQPGSHVVVVVESAVSLPLMPEILGQDLGVFSLSAQHRVPIGQYTEGDDDDEGGIVVEEPR